MPRYFFHVDDGALVPDTDGTNLASIDEARSEAVSLAGSMLNDLDGRFWDHRTPWTLHVTDEDNRLLFSLHFGAEVPSGEVKFIPD